MASSFNIPPIAEIITGSLGTFSGSSSMFGVRGPSQGCRGFAQINLYAILISAEARKLTSLAFFAAYPFFLPHLLAYVPTLKTAYAPGLQLFELRHTTVDTCIVGVRKTQDDGVDVVAQLLYYFFAYHNTTLSPAGLIFKPRTPIGNEITAAKRDKNKKVHPKRFT